MSGSNKGVVYGIIRKGAEGNPVKGAIVKLCRLRPRGALQDVPFYRESPWSKDKIARETMRGIMTNTTPFRPSSMHVYSDGNGRYTIPFTWDAAQIGEYLAVVPTLEATLFVVGEKGKTENRAATFAICPDFARLAAVLPTTVEIGDIADMKGFKLHSVFSKFLSPKLSNMDWVGAAYCNLWLP